MRHPPTHCLGYTSTVALAPGITRDASDCRPVTVPQYESLLDSVSAGLSMNLWWLLTVTESLLLTVTESLSTQSNHILDLWVGNFLIPFNTIVLVSECEDRKRLIEHFWTWTTSDRPICVVSITTFAYVKSLVLVQPFENPTVSIAIIGYHSMFKQNLSTSFR